MDYEKTSKDYLEAWRTSQAEMQALRDLLEAERERVRVLREAMKAAQEKLHTLRVHSDILEDALATTEPEDGK